MTLKIPPVPREPILPDNAQKEKAFLDKHPPPPRHTPYQVESSDGLVRVAIADRDGVVVIYYDKRINWVEMPPDTAIALAHILLRHAGWTGTLEFK